MNADEETLLRTLVEDGDHYLDEGEILEAGTLIRLGLAKAQNDYDGMQLVPTKETLPYALRHGIVRQWDLDYRAAYEEDYERWCASPAYVQWKAEMRAAQLNEPCTTSVSVVVSTACIEPREAKDA